MADYHKSPGKKPPEGSFVLVGWITEVDRERNTITLLPIRGNRSVQQLLGQQVRIGVTEATELRDYGQAFNVSISCEDIAAAQQASIKGARFVSEDGAQVYAAQRIMVNVPLIAQD